MRKPPKLRTIACAGFYYALALCFFVGDLTSGTSLFLPSCITAQSTESNGEPINDSEEKAGNTEEGVTPVCSARPLLRLHAHLRDGLVTSVAELHHLHSHHFPCTSLLSELHRRNGIGAYLRC